MAKRVANPQDVVVAPTPVSETGPEAAVETVVAPEVRFVRNFGDYPNHELTFEDGTKYLFQGSCLITTDAELISKIRSVAAKYSIIE